MLSVRLPEELKKRLVKLAATSKRSKSDIIKDLLSEYLDKLERLDNPYQIGEDLFGRHGSGDGQMSIMYKLRIKEKINEKNAD